MPSQFGRYQSGIEAATGNLVSAYGQMADRTANTIAGIGAGIGQSLASGIEKYAKAKEERSMLIGEIEGLGNQTSSLLDYVKQNPQFQDFVDTKGGEIASTLEKMKNAQDMSLGQLRALANQAKITYSNFGNEFQLYHTISAENEKNAILNAQGQAAGATTTVDDTVKTRASQFDPLKPYATQEVGFIDNLKKLQERYPDAQIDIPSRLEEWRNNVSAQASELAKSNPLGLKVIDQVEAARKIDTATSPDVEGYNEAERMISNPAYTPTAEDLKTLTAATGTAVTPNNITPEQIASVQQVNAVQASAPNAVTTQQQKVALMKKLLGVTLPTLGAVGQALQQVYVPSGKRADVSQEQVQQYRQPSAGDLVSTASKMGYPAYSALGFGANALMAGGTPVPAQAQPTVEQTAVQAEPTAQAQVQPAAQQPAQRPANIPTLTVPEMAVGTAQREVPLDEAEKKQKTLEIFSKILKYGVDENGKQIIAPQAERMYQSMKPEEPKVYHLRDAEGNIVSGTMNAKGDFKQFTSTGKTKSEGDIRLEKASTFGVIDPKTGKVGYEKPVENLNVMVRGKGDFSSPDKAEKFKELLAKSAMVIESMNRVKQIAKDDPIEAKLPYTIAGKEIVNEQSKAIALVKDILQLDRLSDKDVQIIMKRIPAGESFGETPEQTRFQADLIIKDVHNLIKNLGGVHKLDIIVPDSQESTTVKGEDFRSIDARNALMGIPAKR